MIDFFHLVDEFGKVSSEEGRVVIVKEVEVDTMFTTEEESGSESATASTKRESA